VTVLKAFARFWYDFVIGDDWKIAASVAAVLLAGAALVAAEVLPQRATAVLVGVGILAAFTVALVVDTRRAGGAGDR
jgi:hypothetical protein